MDLISRQAAISAICNACGKIDCDKMDKCEKLQLPPANCSEFPNNSDTISRQAAIDFIDAGHLVNPNEPRWSDNEVVNFLKSRPSAQPERKTEWIPCSERLPENDERVLATTAWGEVTIAERIYPPINDTCWFIHDGNTNATIDDVIAWMPLPEPYEGGNDA